MISYYIRLWIFFDVSVKVSRKDRHMTHGDRNKPKELKEEYCLDKLKQNNQV